MSEPALSSAAMSSSIAPTADKPGQLASAANIAKPFQDAITQATAARASEGKKLAKLVGILATPSPPSVAYAQWTKKACEQVGIAFDIWKTWEDKPEEGASPAMDVDEVKRPDSDLEADVEDLIIAANANDDVHGIMVYYPIFGGRQDTYLQQIVDPRKDVEGLHFSYCWNMYHNVRWVLPKQLGGAPGTTSEMPPDREGVNDDENVPPGFAKSILPCTPLAIVKCLEAMGVYDRTLPYGDRLYGKVITVINRSEVVGRPLAALLSNDGAKVYSVDIDSIQEFNKRAGAPTPQQSHATGTLRPSQAVKAAREANSSRRLRPHHVVRGSPLSVQECVSASDVVISGVPAASYKVPTDWIKPGAVTVNFSSEKNFEKDVRTRASIHLPSIGKTTIAMLQRNLLRLVEYRELQEVDDGRHLPSDGGSGGGGGGGPSGGPSGGGTGGPPSGDGARSGAPGPMGFDGPPRPTPGEGGGSSGGGGGPPSHSQQQGGGGGGGGKWTSYAPRRETARDQGEAMAVDAEGYGVNVTSPLSTSLDASKPASFPQSPANMLESRAMLLGGNGGGHLGSFHQGFGNRGRASTMTLPRSDLARERFVGPPLSRMSPTYPPAGMVMPAQTNHTGSTASSANSLWDWRTHSARRDSVTSGTTIGSTPPFGPRKQSYSSSTQSPLLFAPISPFAPPQHGWPPPPPPRASVGSHLQYQHPPNYQQQQQQHQQLHHPHHSHQLHQHPQQHQMQMHSLAGQSPRSETPVSPLYIDRLTVEDGPSVSRRTSWHPVSSTSNGEIHSHAPPLPSVLERPYKRSSPRPMTSPVDRRPRLDSDPSRDAQMRPPQATADFYPHGMHPPSSPAFAGQRLQDGPEAHLQRPRSNSNTSTSLKLQPPPDRIAHSRRRRRQKYSYSTLIAMAISSSPDKRMTLREIYTWISSTFPQTYSMSQADGKGWQNTVRHNLSLNKYFIKAPREHLEIYQSEKSGQPHLSNSARGKGGWWMLDPEISKSLNLDDLKAGMLDAHDLGPRADDDHDSRTPKRGRRGRTSSFATDITSGDEPISPTDPVCNMPSVLQMRGRSPKREYPTVPSVLMPPRTRSAERAVRPPTEGDASSHDGSAHPQHPPLMSTTAANSSSAVQRPAGRSRANTTSITETVRGRYPSILGRAPPLPSMSQSGLPAAFQHYQQGPPPGSPYTSMQVPSHLPPPPSINQRYSAYNSLHQQGRVASGSSSNVASPLSVTMSPSKRKLRFDASSSSVTSMGIPDPDGRPFTSESCSSTSSVDELGGARKTVRKGAPHEYETIKTVRPGVPRTRVSSARGNIDEDVDDDEADIDGSGVEAEEEVDELSSMEMEDGSSLARGETRMSIHGLLND